MVLLLVCFFRIDLHVPRGRLVAIVGHVGSAKSSLLSAMLGEMTRLSGTCAVQVISLIYPDNSS